MVSMQEILVRIDEVIKMNKKTEWIYIICTIILFSTGIACFVTALAKEQFAWSSPAAITTTLLYWPMKEIKCIRQKNIALSTVPILISQLPKVKAAEEIQKLIQSLYQENR